jgi:hypothetical protein
MRALATATALAMAAMACGGADGGLDPASGGAGGASTGAGNGPATTSGGPASTGSGGHVDSVTLTMDPFVVHAGEEVYKCQNFANPFDGDAEIAVFESHMTPGSHHMLLFHGDEYDSDGPLVDCSGLEFALNVFGSQQPDKVMTFPEGVAALVPASTGFRINSHYLNTTGSDISAEVTVTLHRAAPGTVTDHAGTLWVLQQNIDVPPFSTGNASKQCGIPQDMKIFGVSSHMHSYGTHFEATLNGQPLYATDEWADPPPAYFDPAIEASEDDPLTISCDYDNPTSTPLTFGESAASNEMCILTAIFYPVTGGVTMTCR